MWQNISLAALHHGAAPMFTWRSGDSRIELSGKTYLNSVSKAANFLSDGLEVEYGQKVFIDLGNHWQSPVWQAAAVAVGAVINNEPAALNIVNDEEYFSLPNTIALVSKDPFGMPVRDLPGHVINASAEVRGFGDYYAPSFAASEIAPVAAWGINSQQAQEIAASRVADHGIEIGESIAVLNPPNLETAAIWQLYVPIFNKSAVVLLDGSFDREKVQAQEHVAHFVTPI